MKGKVFPVHNNQFKFGTGGLNSTEQQMVMPKDLENFRSEEHTSELQSQR